MAGLDGLPHRGLGGALAIVSSPPGGQSSAERAGGEGMDRSRTNSQSVSA
jgi:hypothetical protein